LAKIGWIAADWGTSNVRVWGMTPDNQVIFAASGSQGMASLSPAEYPDVLLSLLGEHAAALHQNTPVMICGMAGARQGWREAPYLDSPAMLTDIATCAVVPPMADKRLAPRILPGICRTGDAGDNVMRGEETQLLGLLALRPGFSGVVCMPGTHSKWVRIDGGKCLGFETAMTGELYDVLGHHSVLRHSLAGDLTGPDRDDGFAVGLAGGLAAPERLTSLLFRTRAASLLSDRTPGWCAGYLSGLLIGAEVAAYRSWRTREQVVLIGSARLCGLYASAIAIDGGSTDTVDATDATLQGLAKAREHVFD